MTSGGPHWAGGPHPALVGCVPSSIDGLQDLVDGWFGHGLGAKGPVQLLHDLIGAMAAISEVDNKVPDTGHDEGRKKREKLERVAKVFFSGAYLRSKK